ncbi:MAG: helix-turn-helix domain-containing protein [Gammaproteobacteria bacterium]|nr:helix-turn-helix domain-containing protein [Gammaproteobacteria bacterium]
MSLKSDTAGTLYKILTGHVVAGDELNRAAQWFEKLDTPIDQSTFIAYAKTLQREAPQHGALHDLIARWQAKHPAQGGFSEEAADAFLQDYIVCLDPNLLFRAPITAGYAQWDEARLTAGFSYASHSEQTWSLLVCDTGGARLRGGGRELAVRSGQVLLVGPGALCTLQALAGHRRWGYFWAVFYPDSRWLDWLRWPEFAPKVSHLELPATQRTAVLDACEALQRCLHAKDAMSMELSHNLLEQLILRCRACLPADFQAHRDPRIERAREFIEQHYTESFRHADVAAAANLSASRLADLFRQQCGLTVLGYRDEMRMVQAARLLRQRSTPIADIGEAVGFSDPAYFSRMFAKHIGMSPREYQKQG